jgi:hypothetical protein
MASYLILGSGKFGRLALERLARLDAAASFLVVDSDPESLVMSGGGPGYQQVQAEAIAFLVQHLKSEGQWDWIVPMVPLHVAFHWLVQGPLRESGWQPAAVPEALALLIPGTRNGPEGELYLSRAAHHVCPDDCPEPEVCPVSGEPRDLPLHQELASLHLPGYQVRVIPSRQLAPGVGGFSPGRLLDLARDLDALTGKVLIATACLCHGVMHGLVRSGR